MYSRNFPLQLLLSVQLVSFHPLLLSPPLSRFRVEKGKLKLKEGLGFGSERTGKGKEKARLPLMWFLHGDVDSRSYRIKSSPSDPRAVLGLSAHAHKQDTERICELSKVY